MVAHFMGERPVQIPPRLEGSNGAQSIVQDRDAIAHVSGRAQKGKPLGSSTSVVPIDFRDDKHIDIVVPHPRSQRFDGHLVSTGKQRTRGDAILRKPRNA